MSAKGSRIFSNVVINESLEWDNYLTIIIMKKKYFSYLMAVLMLAVIGSMLGSCGSSKDDADESGVPDVNPQLDWNFTYETSQANDGSVVIKWKVEEAANGILETGEARVSCTHENDGYAGPREASLEYSQNHTSHGKAKTETKYAKDDKIIYVDSATTTAQVEDGNLIYCYRSQDRVACKINGKQYELPYIKVDQPVLEKLDLLPGTAKTRAGDKVIVDSICRAPVWKVKCTVENYKEAISFDVQVSDLFKVYQLDETEIKSGKITGVDRVPLDETTERCDVFIEWTKTDESTHNSTMSKILTRSITPKPRWEVFVNDFDFRWQSDKAIVTGAETKAESDENWTVYGRTDLFGAIIANGGDPNIETSYELYHQRATYKDEKFGLSHSFDYVSFDPREKSTTEEDISSSRDKYDAKHLQNTITTSYLGHSQDAKEDVILFKAKPEEEKPTFDGWDEVSSYRVDEDERTIWHTEYLYEINGKSTRTVFDWIQPRVLEYLGPWTAYESSNTWETSGVASERAGTEPVELEQNGAKAKWDVLTFDIQSTVSLAGSKQYDKWRSKEGNNFSVTYRGKTLTLSNKGRVVNNKAELNDAGVNGDYHDWKHTNVLTYKWGDNVKNSNATGIIKVREVQEESYFFPPEWGGVKGVRQTVTNNEGHNGWDYAWSIQFGKGVLPVFVPAGTTVPNFRFELFEYTDVKNYNSATYIIKEDTWVNTTASDMSDRMVWEREGREYENKDYTEAGRQNWDAGHTVDGHPSVHTTRYQLDVNGPYLSVSDSYGGCFMGSWK